MSDQHQVVAVEVELSTKLLVVSGVPQGGVLGLLLLIMHINNIVTVISSGSEINMFADDIALYRIITSPNDYVMYRKMSVPSHLFSTKNI